MKTKSNFAKDFAAALTKQPTWTLKVTKVLAGERVDDEAHFSKNDLRLSITNEGATFTSPFAHVTVTPKGKKFDLELSRCANPGLEDTKSIDTAAFKFAATIWHVALRGVI